MKMKIIINSLMRNIVPIMGIGAWFYMLCTLESINYVHGAVISLLSLLFIWAMGRLFVKTDMYILTDIMNLLSISGLDAWAKAEYGRPQWIYNIEYVVTILCVIGLITLFVTVICAEKKKAAR